MFFRPDDGWVGDVIPFVADDGVFWLFYLHERRDQPDSGTPWSLVTTKDFTQFEDHGVVLPNGGPDDADFNAYTGSVISVGKTHHLFYTGQNPRHGGPDGQPLQLVMHATSTDGMASWVKHPDQTFGAFPGYEPGDWRDPFVLRDPRTGQWRMLLAARHDSGPARRRGVVAQCVSWDLVTWEPAAPFWDPGRYVTQECPDVFSWGDWWYLVYSEFSESFTTRYRMASSPDGPWTVPAQDTIDGRAFYASKTAERDGHRFFFGWIASKGGDRDDGPWQWAGTLSVLEARQNADGSLAFAIPEEHLDSFCDTSPVALDADLPATLDAPDGYAAALSADVVPLRSYVRLVLDIQPGTTECGLLLRAAADGDESYVLRLEPKRHRMVLDRWPRSTTGPMQWQVSGDVPFSIELERPCDLTPGVHVLEVVTDGDLCVASVDRQVALSARLYDRPAGRVGVFVGEGCTTIREFDIRQRPSD